MKKLIIILTTLISVSLTAHSGRTDKNGGHHDRINGGYHYHHGMRSHQHPNGKCELSTITASALPINTIFGLGIITFAIGYHYFQKRED